MPQGNSKDSRYAGDPRPVSIVNLVVDIVHAVLDSRVRYG